MYLYGALFELSTGQVKFLGEHPNRDIIMKSPRDDETSASSFKPPVPAEEALAALQCGNLRAHCKTAAPGRNGGQNNMTPRSARGGDRDAGENDPIAVVFMSFDPHKGEGPLVESIFDMHPSLLACISTKVDDAEEHAFT